MRRLGDAGETPRSGVASMVDVAFLMLVFFLVATTIAPREADLLMKSPTPGPGIETPVLPLHLEIEGDDSIWWGEGAGRLPVSGEDRKLPELVALLAPAAAAARAGGEEPPVILKVAGEASQQSFINVMDALATVQMNRVWLRDFD